MKHYQVTLDSVTFLGLFVCNWIPTIIENVDTWTHAKTFVMMYHCIVATYVSKCSSSVGRFAARVDLEYHDTCMYTES